MMKTKILEIDSLKIAEYNPRKNLQPGDIEYDNIKKSIEEFGYVEPIIVNESRNNTIIGGHQRVKVLKDLGVDKINCVIVNYDNVDDEKALNVALNKISGEWDMDKLAPLLSELNKINKLEFTGFDEKEFDTIMNEFKNDNKDIEDDNFKYIEGETRVKEGDIFKCGEHLLLCGDSFKEKDRNKLIKNVEIDLLITDPPYNIGNEERSKKSTFNKSTKRVKDRIENIVDFDYKQLSFLPDMDIKSYYIFTAKSGIKDYLNIFNKFNFDILTWCKTNPTPLIANSFFSDIEYCMYFRKKDRIWNSRLKPTEIYKKYYISSITDGRKEDGDLHPTMKPLKLIGNRIKISSNKEGYVLDLFGGSGTTLIACEQLNRKCLMIEKDTKYCNVILQRFEKYTNNKVVKL